MKNLYQALATAAGAFFIACAPVQATPTILDKAEADLIVHFSLLRDYGVAISWDHPDCKSNPRLLGQYRAKSNEIVLCTDNLVRHGADTTLTLKHESIHLAQACARRRLFPSKDFTSKVEIPPGYEAEEIKSEAEARYLSEKLSLLNVTSLVVQTCEQHRV